MNMNENATRKDIDEVITILRDFIEQVDTRFNKMEEGIAELKDSHNRLLNTIDGFIG